MKSILFKFSSLLFLLFANSVYALDILIYHNNTAYTDTKAGLEAQGHTVTGSTSTTTASASTLANYDVVIDQLYNNNCGANCRGNYDTYVKNGGQLIIVGENSYYSSRNSNIVSLIENKFGGTLDLGSNVYGGTYYTGGTNNTVNTSVSNADDGGQYIYGSSIASTSDGLWVAKTSGGAIIWMMWRGDDLPLGYTGSVTVTFDINQFQSTYDSDATFEYIDDVMYYGENGSMATATYSSAPTTEQLNKRTNTRNITNSGNDIYIQQSGNNVTINVTQQGDDNMVAGVNTTSQTTTAAQVSGNYNTVDIDQMSDDNILLFGINGDHDTMNVSQGDYLNDTGGHRAIVDITGSYNQTSLTQYNVGFGSGQFADINVNGDDNTISSYQRETDKMLFIDIDGDDNSVTTNQKDSGEHFLDITLGSNQTVGITQQGTGDHAATIDMSGYSSELQLNQNSSTDQVYSLTQICTDANGCGTTTITQQ